MMTRLWNNLLKLEHHASFRKTEEMNYENSHSKYSFAISAHYTIKN